MEDPISKRAVAVASVALLVFSAFSSVALFGWFSRHETPWNWKSVLAIGCSILAIMSSALLWRSPTRAHALMGIAVMLGSLARIGAPAQWTWVSFALVALTFVLLMPLVHAAIVLRDDSQG
ncbi:MAG TPA: hypothetical protein VM580_25590 [Labilithrix sp.]|nr:hypothetical protein [Labilithrix sp.]